MSSEVVVTGMGMTTPVGGDVKSNWEAILAGRPGISVIDQTWVADQPAKIAGLLAVEPGTVLEKHETRRMDRSQQSALIAAREAWEDAGSPVTSCSRFRSSDRAQRYSSRRRADLNSPARASSNCASVSNSGVVNSCRPVQATVIEP